MSELLPTPPTPSIETPAWYPIGEPLRVRRNPRDRDLLVITVEGELDLVGARVLERVLAEELPRLTVLDLGGVTFLAAAGLRVLVHAVNHAKGDHRRVAIVAATRPVLRVLRLFADDVRTPVHARTADAVRELSGCPCS